jgi:hypothetical protein
METVEKVILAVLSITALGLVLKDRGAGASAVLQGLGNFNASTVRALYGNN